MLNTSTLLGYPATMPLSEIFDKSAKHLKQIKSQNEKTKRPTHRKTFTLTEKKKIIKYNLTHSDDETSERFDMPKTTVRSLPHRLYSMGKGELIEYYHINNKMPPLTLKETKLIPKDLKLEIIEYEAINGHKKAIKEYEWVRVKYNVKVLNTSAWCFKIFGFGIKQYRYQFSQKKA